jgi:FlaA1/EpsC-like NDP-sugar epimerase
VTQRLAVRHPPRMWLRWLPVDSAVWFLAVLVADWSRYDFIVPDPNTNASVAFALGAVVVNAFGGTAAGIYTHRYVPGSFEETERIIATALLNTSVLVLANIVREPHPVPRGVPVMAGIVAVVGVCSIRFAGRAWETHRRDTNADSMRVIVLGAGCSGARLIKQMQSDPSSPYLPVALLDDDVRKHRMRVSGLEVCGTKSDLASVAALHSARAVVVAVPDPRPSLIREVTRIATEIGLRSLVVPTLAHLMDQTAGAQNIREVNVNDLLGRPPIHLDDRSIESTISGRRVLVTGAGGSIGSELCRHIHRFAPAELIMLDHDESALHATQLTIYGRAMLDGPETVLADIRDSRAISRVFDEHRPEVVFHTAALKHLPMLERYPIEAWMSNVVGTSNVLQAARDAGVSAFVNISTDKAANPANVLGYSKRIAERLTAAAAIDADGLFVSVRFGNVLQSRGSVLLVFGAQIKAGGPLTVTDPEVSRYFITVDEASQLVLQASAVGLPGEALILDMGTPVRIAEVARTMIQKESDPGLGIVFTGLREGEKLHEELFGANEPIGAHRSHPLISHVDVPPLELTGADIALDRFTQHAEARAWMKQTAQSLASHPESV